MKMIMSVFAAVTLMGSSAFAAAPVFYCQASKKAPYYDSETHYEVSFTKTKMKLAVIRYNTVARERTQYNHEYTTKGALQGGEGAAKDMMIYQATDILADFANTIFVTAELRDGGIEMRNGKMGGIFKFIGLHYQYETYYCFQK